MHGTQVHNSEVSSSWWRPFEYYCRSWYFLFSAGWHRVVQYVNDIDAVWDQNRQFKMRMTLKFHWVW